MDVATDPTEKTLFSDACSITGGLLEPCLEKIQSFGFLPWKKNPTSRVSIILETSILTCKHNETLLGIALISHKQASLEILGLAATPDTIKAAGNKKQRIGSRLTFSILSLCLEENKPLEFDSIPSSSEFYRKLGFEINKKNKSISSLEKIKILIKNFPSWQ